MATARTYDNQVLETLILVNLAERTVAVPMTMAKVDVDDLKRQRDRWLARELGIADKFGWDCGPYL